MSEGTVSAEPGQADGGARIEAEPIYPPPWGFWSTAAWTLISFAVAVAVIFGTVYLIQWPELETPRDPVEDPSFSLQLIIINGVQIVVLAGAARLARWPVGRYLGLVRPRGRDLLHGVSAVALLLAVLEILTRLLGRESVTPFQSDAYRAAQSAGMLAMMWFAFVVAAPIGEEITFRGFLFRGWAASRLGPVGTVVLTSLIFAVLHTQYDWFGGLQTFSMG